ncbi:hypothetical protein X949_5348 [Burkholderia pseudomallei MSHR5609]|nr:hypothetical protein X977_5216 [Burkholderia pseudomallei MSHR7504]KGS37423.1 hypothetical protein X945_5300 [Burkholderia pseudomallei ABCPW 107]KGS54426.1 hypothetical protein X949_5348 [Burkholderia pseudomallei MSHR5609]KGS75516.1 hypothetical protein X947_5314 [Burkholderia pseudomallei MSHR7334]KGX50767.1 hypothetical protein Y025_5304 [Burkholderia pseudomallei TSV32]KOS95773.1 hypothetical protein DM49_2236 [Burkholderia mallei]
MNDGANGKIAVRTVLFSAAELCVLQCFTAAPRFRDAVGYASIRR